jgi:hypothetical protein
VVDPDHMDDSNVNKLQNLSGYMAVSAFHQDASVNMVNPQRVAEELMSSEERTWHEQEAQQASEKGENPNPYWSGLPQLNTVGYLTGTAGALAAGFAIGWITGRFDPPFERLQMNLVAKLFDVQEVDQTPRDFCACRRVRGWADQSLATRSSPLRNTGPPCTDCEIEPDRQRLNEDILPQEGEKTYSRPEKTRVGPCLREPAYTNISARETPIS